jgi:hypothetical protein
MTRHIKWTREAYGIPDAERPLGLNAGSLLSEQREFADSASSLGLQLADMLATIPRRAFNDERDSTRLLGKETQIPSPSPDPFSC